MGQQRVSLQSQLTTLQVEAQAAKEALEIREADLRASEELQAVLRQEIEGARKRAEAASQDAQRTIAELRKQSTSLAHERDELETELQHARQRLTQSAHEARLEQQAAADQLALAKRDLEELRESARATKGELASTKQDAAQVRQALARKEDECSGLRQEIEQMQGLLGKMQQELSAALEEAAEDFSRREATLRRALGDAQQVHSPPSQVGSCAKPS